MRRLVFSHFYVMIKLSISCTFILDYKGKGYGKILWEYVIEKANELGLKSFTIDSDPNAKGYYLKMGAQLIGETPSTVFKGRVLPLLRYDV